MIVAQFQPSVVSTRYSLNIDGDCDSWDDLIMIMLGMVMIGMMENLNFELCQPLSEHCGPGNILTEKYSVNMDSDCDDGDDVMIEMMRRMLIIAMFCQPLSEHCGAIL